MYRLSIIIGEIYNKFLPRAEQGGVSLNLDFSDMTQEVSDPEEIRTAIEQALDSAFQRTDRGNISISVTPDEIVIADSGTILSKNICALLSHGRVQVKSRVGFGTSVHVALGPVTPSNDVQSKTDTASDSNVQGKANAKPSVAKGRVVERIAPSETQSEPSISFTAEIGLSGQTPTVTSQAPAAAGQTSTAAGQTFTAPAQKIPAKKPPVKKSVQKISTDKKSAQKTPLSQRPIDAAAKRADKKLQKIAEKAQKRLEKANAKTKKANAKAKAPKSLSKLTTKTQKSSAKSTAKTAKSPVKSAAKPKKTRKVVRKFDIS